jgi:hypothetical protein
LACRLRYAQSDTINAQSFCSGPLAAATVLPHTVRASVDPRHNQVSIREGGSMIKNRHIAFVLFFMTMAIGVACAEAPGRPNYTRAEIQKMVRDAHTSEQYRELAEYYRYRQQNFELRARAEKHEWVRRTFDVSSPGKYPSPEDSSKNRYEYFTYQAAKMGLLAARYSMLAAELMP